jgi:hypothetical protein
MPLDAQGINQGNQTQPLYRVHSIHVFSSYVATLGLSVEGGFSSQNRIHRATPHSPQSIFGLSRSVRRLLDVSLRQSHNTYKNRVFSRFHACSRELEPSSITYALVGLGRLWDVAPGPGPVAPHQEGAGAHQEEPYRCVAVCCLLSAVRCLLSAVCCLLSAVRCL